MFLTLISLAAAQDLGSNTLHLGVQATTNDPFVSTTMGTLALSHSFNSWLGMELGGGLALPPNQSSVKPLTTQLDSTTEIYPDVAYLRVMGWTGVRLTPFHQEWGGLKSHVGVHLGAGAINSVENSFAVPSSSTNETSAAARYGLHSTLSWGRFGFDLSLTRTRHEESFGIDADAPYTASRQNIWVNGGLSCRL